MLESGHFLGSVGEGQIHVLITFLPAGPANCAAFNAAAAGGPGIATTSLAIAVRAGATGFGPTDLLAAAGSPPPRSAGVMVKVTPDAMLVFPVGGMTWAITAS